MANYVKEYNDKIQNGEVIVCKELKNTYSRMVKEMELSDDISFPYVFSEETGEYVITFIENFCRHYEGAKAGELVVLDLWQKAYIQCLFGWLEKETGLRRFREAFVLIARKNGKSFLAGCIAVYMLVADGESGAQVYSVANKLAQAQIIYNVAKAIIEQSPELRSICKSTREGIKFMATRSVFKALPCEAKTSDGLNISYSAIDEIHESRNRAMYDVIRQGTKARKQPLITTITTNGFVRGQVFDDLLSYAKDVSNGVVKDDRFLPILYMLDSKDEWVDINMLPKANPALGTIKSIEMMKEDIERAKNDVSYLPTFLVKDCNIAQTENSAWLSYEDIYNDTVVDMDYLKHSYAIGGCDLSATTDLTCATLLIRKPNDENVYVLQQYFLPKSRVEHIEDCKSKEAPYELWAKNGWMTICDGTQVNYSDVTAWFNKMVQEYDIRPLFLCFDRSLSGYWVEEMTGYGYNMEKIPQGAFTWSQPMKEMGATFKAHKVVYNKNPMLLWCMCNTAKHSTNADGIETIKPIKIQKNRRIDGMVSLLNAWVGYVRHYSEYMSLVR